MDLWHCGWELGNKDSTSAIRQFQDIWAGSHAYQNYLDVDAGEDVASGTGRFAISLSAGGFGDYEQFTGHHYEKSGDIIYWRIRFKQAGLTGGTPALADIYWFAKL